MRGAFGLGAARARITSSPAARSRWPVIGLAMFAANISTVHLVSFAETAYKYGMVFGNFEWMAGFTLILLSLFFAPLYLRSRVPTLPDFLERRFNRHCRDLLTVISIFSAVVIHIGVALYTAALVLRGILGIDEAATICGISSMMFFIIVLAVLTGIYTMIGGLLAVVWTESIQTVLLLVGAVCITAVGYYHVGGWSGLTHTLASRPHPLAGAADPKMACNWSTGNFLSILRGADDPSKQPWLGILLGYPVIGIWYWCCDQTIVQRVLAARDEKQARLGPLFCSFLKILPVFFFVLPGVICVALVQQGFFQAAAPTNPKDTYTFMVTHMLPWGMKGLVTAAMLAAAMQTCSAALNSTATLFAYDIVKRYRPQTSDHRLVVDRQDHHRRGHDPGDRLVAHLRPEGHGLSGADRYHLLCLAADHSGLSLGRVLEAGHADGPPFSRCGWATYWASASSSSICSRLTPAGARSSRGTRRAVGYELTLDVRCVLPLHALRPDCRGQVLRLPRAIEGRGQTARVGGLARAASRRGARARLGQLPHPVGCRMRDVHCALYRF